MKRRKRRRREASEVAVMRGWTDWPGEGEMEGFLECWREGCGGTRKAAPFVRYLLLLRGK